MDAFGKFAQGQNMMFSNFKKKIPIE